jgi:translocation and assembly module TamB
LTDAALTPPAKPARRPRRSVPRRLALGLLIAAVALVIIAAVAAVGVRYGVRTDYGLTTVTRLLDGLSLGRYGTLQISGVKGDLFGDLTIERAAIVDQDGVWIEGRDIAVQYRPRELFARRFHATRIEAALVRGVRRPNPEPPDGKPEKPLPVAVVIDAARLRLETLPALSRERGVFDVNAAINLQRSGPWTGRVNAASLLRPGDGLDAIFRVKDGDRFRVNARAVEARGGAIAGLIGLSPDRPFRLDVNADGASAGGELFLLAQSGDERPAEARGRWSKAGGSATGRVNLAASTLTAPYAAWVGPEASFQVEGRRVRDGVYGVQLNAQAENARIIASGPIETAERRAPEGLRVRAEIDDLSRILPNPDAGATVVDGTVRGDPEDFTFEGRGSVADLTTPQFRLASVAGPVQVSRRRGDLMIEADLTGAGGAGQGLLAALLGRAPTVKLAASQLRDGRFLIRSLQARGAGLSVDASGSRGLLGDLAFRGEATLSNLAQAYPEARGSLAGSWSARQGGGDRPWTFTVDARGERFASGLAEADRLLGTTPRIRAEAIYAASGDVEVTRAALDGAKANVTAEGTLARAGQLAFDLDWRAAGPFQAGPIEIAGGANGTGALRGTLANPRADLVANFDAIDFERIVITPARLALSFVRTPTGGDGRVALTGGSTYGPASASADFSFVTGGVDLRDIALDAAGVRGSGAVALRNGAPSTANLQVAVGPGVLLEAGQASGTVRLTDGPGAARAAVQLTGENLVIRGAAGTPIERIRLTAEGPLTRMPFQLSVAAPNPQPVSFDGSGVFSRTGQETAVTLTGRGEARDIPFSTVEPVAVRFGPAGNRVRARLAVGGGQAFVEGSQVGEVVNALATLDRVEISTFTEDFAGTANARATLQGQGRRLNGTLTAVLDDARSLDAPPELAVDGRVQATLANNRIRLAASATNAAGLRARADVDLPAEASAQPLRLAINRTQPIRGDFSAQGELRSLWDLFFGAERTLSGRLAASGTIAGTLNEPRLRGVANVTDGAFRDAATGLELRRLTLAADLADTAVVVRQLTASDSGRGTITGQGRIGLTRNAASTFRADLNRFQVLDSELGEATASGRIEVERNARGQNAVAGKLTVDRAEIAANPPGAAGVVSIDVVEINVPVRAGQRRRAAAATAAAGTPAPGGPAVALNIDLTAPRGLFVRGRGLDLELSLDATVRGTTAAPVLGGVARVVRGSYEFAGKRFEFDERGSVRLASDPDDIRLDLTAVRDDPALTARVRVTGTAAEPIVALSSTPQLPQDEILSQVLFGRSASQLSALEAAQLASALSSLATGGGFDVIGGLRELAGLDRLSLGGGAGGPTIAGGKYLTEDVYLEIIGGGREGPAAEVEWRVRRNLSIVSRVGGESGTRLSVRYRRNF